MKNNFKQKYGKWALITGATSGIGAELANQLANKGINILLVARNEADLKKHANQIQQKYGNKTDYIAADLSTADGIEKVKATPLEIDLLIPAAGMEINGAFEKNHLESEKKLIHLNVISTFELLHHFSAAMINRGKGGILLLASTAAHMPNPYFSNYAGSKAYIMNLGKSVYAEFKRKGVDVSILSPGLTDTPMTLNNGINWSKTPMLAMKPEKVAAMGIAGLGNKMVIVPGLLNRVLIFLMNITPIKLGAIINEKIIRNAIDTNKV
ncbi:SDR family NAD(P)-dependent oxidoreductase [uncultured Shewanella sp.]|uniref:SDR family NAD(P)-dependent oxidoreductase n=1 Tax=uncultured Shewanella sp. TaxID=173975 RepID=UPI00261B7163|nr:SDR family NAD(P)-dependent oxidoreductase [uncultured Shewanella sp.]